VYVTAHRLVTPLGDEGVNVFLHLHGADFAWPEDPGALAKHHPGELEERKTELPPGGNRVVAFLDVLAPDGTGRAAVREAVTALAAELEGRASPTWFERGAVTIQFGVDADIAKRGLEARRAALEELHAAADGLMKRRSAEGH
jgi:hypothetical protein